MNELNEGNNIFICQDIIILLVQTNESLTEIFKNGGFIHMNT